MCGESVEEGRKVGTHRLCLGLCTFLLPQGAPEYFSSPLHQERLPLGHPAPASSGLRWLVWPQTQESVWGPWEGVWEELIPLR